jgi:glycosyltransferase involved in cell wall biosynthesis
MLTSHSLSFPSVSVIIPCFNAEAWIIRAIKSVEKQSFQACEIIIVDDGSTDQSIFLIKSYFCSIPLSILKQINSGPAAARNYGVNKSIGDYIAFLDADDEWDENKMNKQILTVNPSSFSTSDCTLIDRKNNHIGDHHNFIPNSKESILKNLYLGRISMLTPGLLIPRDKFLDVGGFDVNLRYKEDHLLILKLISSGLTFNYVHEKLFKVRVHSESGRNSINEMALKKSFYAFSDKAILDSPSLQAHKKEFTSEVYYILAKAYLGEKPLKALKNSINAFLSYPSGKTLIIILLSAFPIKKETALIIKNKIKNKFLFK